MSSQGILGVVPTKIFFTKGVGVHKESLQSFELALRSAGIEKFNLVTVSSILPAGCRIVGKQRGLSKLTAGQIVPVVMSRNATSEPHRMIAASIGLAVPADAKRNYGYISEHHSFGENELKAGDYCEDLAAMMLATTMGLTIDPDKDYDERKEIYRMSGKIVHTRSITQTARGDKNGLWKTVVAAAVML